MKKIRKSILGLAVGAITLPSTVSLAMADTQFQGVMTFTAATGTGCNGGAEAGNVFYALYHPKAVAGNSNFSAFNGHFPFGGATRGWGLAGGSFTTSFQQVNNTSLSGMVFTPEKPSFVLVSAQAPATITATTPSVTVVGMIRNPWGLSGSENCVVSFRMVGLKG